MAEKEWNAFVDTLVPKIMDIDDEIPYMPSKDLVHRIYRDVRFSNDKTPYKKVSSGFCRLVLRSSISSKHVGLKSLIPDSSLRTRFYLRAQSEPVGESFENGKEGWFRSLYVEF